MAINKNHECEELNGIKCAVVEKSVNKTRVDFLAALLQSNGYDVVIAPATAAKASTTVDASQEIEQAASVELFTIGVTDLSFNPINAIFGRLLKAPGNKVVTLAYWQQKTIISDDEVPYFSQEAL